MILPSCTIAFVLLCSYTRLLRADMVEQLSSEDYIVTARAKGIPPWMILVRHALRNSVFGLITLIGLNLGTLIGGTVIVEQIFALPGIGQQLLYSIGVHDVIVVEAIVTVLAVAVVLSNLAADLLYAVLDPRIRYGSRAS
jgi:peptide/nickel transport system permease protein